MKLRKIMIGLVVTIMLTGCNHIESTVPLTDEYQEKINEETTQETETDVTEGEEKVKRECCKVESLEKDYFVLENTKGETYQIDNAFLDKFKENDNVLLIYYDRQEIGELTYEATVKAVFPNDQTLLTPAK